MRIIYYDQYDIAGDYLVEIDSLILPQQGDKVSIRLEGGRTYDGKVIERSFILEGNELSFISVVCVGNRF